MSSDDDLDSRGHYERWCENIVEHWVEHSEARFGFPRKTGDTQVVAMLELIVCLLLDIRDGVCGSDAFEPKDVKPKGPKY